MTVKNELQPGEIIQDLQNIGEIIKEGNIQLTPEVKSYFEEMLNRLNDKLANREPVYPKDIEFIERIKTWIEIGGSYTFKQMDELLLLAEEAKKDKKWIRDMFRTDEPQRITVKNLNLRWSGVTRLPEGLTVEFALNLEGCKSLKELPTKLEVLEDLFLMGTNINNLPDDLIVMGSLELSDCKELKSLENIPVESLQEELNIHNLDLSGHAGITSLPVGIKLNSLALLNNDVITGLPEGMDVHTLIISNCPRISNFPEDIRIKIIRIKDDPVKNDVIKKEAERLKKLGKIEKIQIY